MKPKTLFATLLVCLVAFSAKAQSDYAIEHITVVNVGDGRMLFRSFTDEQPLNGTHRIIDGRRSEFTLAEFSNGFFNGTFERHRHNQLVERGTYKEGVRHGTFYEYFSGPTTGGNLRSQRPFVEGRLHGMVKTFFTNGMPESKKEYENGVEHGIEQRWTLEHSTQTHTQTVNATFVNGRPHGKQTRHITSNVGNFVEIAHFDNGVRIGEFSQTWSNGQVRIQGIYDNGNRNGVWTEYRQNGHPQRSTTYENGRRHGEFRTFFNDGSVERIDMFQNGEREGVSKEFFSETGNLRAKYHYVNGIKEGAYQRFYDDGSIRERGQMERGREISRTEYFRNGQVRQVSERNTRGQWEVLESYNSDGTQR